MPIRYIIKGAISLIASDVNWRINLLLKRGAAEAATNVEGFDSQFGEVDVKKRRAFKKRRGWKSSMHK